MMFKESITKEELTDLPLRWFEGEIVVVDSMSKIEEGCKNTSEGKGYWFRHRNKTIL